MTVSRNISCNDTHRLSRRPFSVGLRCLLLMLLLFKVADLNATAEEKPLIKLTDVTKAAGIRFLHYSPLSRKRHLHLFMGSGIAWLDYDRDGWPDLYLAQGREWPHKPSPNPENSNRVFRNSGDGTFADVTIDANLTNLDYSMGTAVGDYDNDGFPDLFVSSFGVNRLYRNNGDGTFTELAAQLGLDDGRYGASCTWADINNDGNLDLFVVNYIKIDHTDYPLCRDTYENREYPASCHPRYLKGDYDLLYKNEGDGSFTDITQSAGLKAGTPRQGLGIVAADLDGDNDIDFYVANDSVPNQLWINQGADKFIDMALLSGVAVNRRGLAEAGMGLALGDVDGDGRFDIFVTNYFSETNTLYRNDGSTFTDVTSEFGLGAPSKSRLAFGTSLFDVDNDGWLDLFVANGHIHTHRTQIGWNEPFAQQPQIHRNRDGRRFDEMTTKAGSYFRRKHVGRGSAIADFDRDGRTDFAITHLNRPATLLRNETPDTGNSLQLELVGTRSNRDGIGAVVEVTVGERHLLRTRHGSSSYLSCDDGRLLIGIGAKHTAKQIEVRWPGGGREIWNQVSADRVHRLVEGTGSARSD